MSAKGEYQCPYCTEPCQGCDWDECAEAAEVEEWERPPEVAHEPLPLTVLPWLGTPTRGGL